ncbi:MAG TPA: hypothetical protein VIV66_03340 [Pyrinomonadaceae bacterium]
MSDLFLPRPWWVNLLILVPVLTFFFFRNNRPSLGIPQLLVSGLFAIAFSFVEASVVIYLRAITGFLTGGGLAEVGNFSSSFYQDARIVPDFPPSLLKIEVLREAATILMLGFIALLTVRGIKERWAVFLWAFAIWDIFYYVSLRLTVGWPSSLKTPDVLFLIPVPWISQVWFPLAVSTLTLLSILAVRTGPREKRVYHFS